MNDVNEISLVEEKIPSISKLNNFAFDAADSVKAWRAYGIGDGKEMPLAKNLTGALKEANSLYTLCTHHAHRHKYMFMYVYVIHVCMYMHVLIMYVFIYLFICSFIHLFIYLFIYLSIYLLIYLFIY